MTDDFKNILYTLIDFDYENPEVNPFIPQISPERTPSLICTVCDDNDSGCETSCNSSCEKCEECNTNCVYHCQHCMACNSTCQGECERNGQFLGTHIAHSATNISAGSYIYSTKYRVQRLVDFINSAIDKYGFSDSKINLDNYGNKPVYNMYNDLAAFVRSHMTYGNITYDLFKVAQGDNIMAHKMGLGANKTCTISYENSGVEYYLYNQTLLPSSVPCAQIYNYTKCVSAMTTCDNNCEGDCETGQRN